MNHFYYFLPRWIRKKLLYRSGKSYIKCSISKTPGSGKFNQIFGAADGLIFTKICNNMIIYFNISVDRRRAVTTNILSNNRNFPGATCSGIGNVYINTIGPSSTYYFPSRWNLPLVWATACNAKSYKIWGTNIIVPTQV